MTGTPFPIDPVLTGVSLAHKNAAMVADRVLPFASTPIETSEFKWNRFDFNEVITADSDGRVGRKSAPDEIEYGMTEDTASVEDYGFDDVVPNDDIAKAPKGFDPLAFATEMLTDRLMLVREKRVATKVFDPATYPAGNKLTLSGTSQWSHVDSDPAAAIGDAADSMVTRPNCMVIGRAGWSKLRRHPKLLKATSLSGTDQGALTLAQAQEALEIPEIIVGEGWINLQRRGQAPVRQRVWGKHAALFYRAPSIAPNGRVMTFGWTQAFGTRVAGQIPEPKIGLRGSIRVRAGHSVKELISAPEAGFLFTDIIA